MVNGPMVNIADIVNKRREAVGKHTLPHWLFRPLARLIHQDEINRILTRYADLPTYDFLRAIIHDELQCTYSVHPQSSIPNPQSSERSLLPTTYYLLPNSALFVSNHPLGGLDGMILILALHDMGYNVKVIVNDFLMAIPPLAPLFVPVNKIGGQKREYVDKMHQLWASNSPILSFPAGVCSRLIDGKVQDLPWKPTYLKQAKKYNREIIRIHFEGQNSMFFYRVAQLRKWLHIPFNFEMLLLPHEMFHARGQHFDIHLSPITYHATHN